MKTPSHKPVLLSLFAMLLAVCPAIADAGPAGHFQFVGGEVRIVDSAGRERLSKKGDEINEGDTIVTAKTASAQIRMIDGGFMAVRPDTRLKIDTFKYEGKEDGTERGFFSLVRGGFRAITGAVGNINKQNYEIKTPAATIGIRGTDHEPMYIAPPQAGETTLGEPGAYDKVNVGAAYIRTEVGSVNIGPNQVGYAAGANAAPTVLPAIPSFYKATPAPETRKPEEKKEAKGESATEAKPEGPHAGKSGGEATGGGGTSAEDSASHGTGGAASTGESHGTEIEPIRITVHTDDLISIRPSGGEKEPFSPPTTTSSNNVITAEDDEGNTHDLSTQTTITKNGETTALGTTPTTTQFQPLRTFALAGYAYNTEADPAILPATRSFHGAAVFDAGKLISATDSGLEPDIHEISASDASRGEVHSAPNGVIYGVWENANQNAILSGTETLATGPQDISDRIPLTGYHWVTGPDIAPNFLPMALTGTATYTLTGNTTPLDQDGGPGQLDTAHTTLSVNFTQQSADVHILAFSGDPVVSPAFPHKWQWTADAANIMLNDDGGFNAYTGAGLSERNLVVNLVAKDNPDSSSSSTGTNPTAWGSISGNLFGASLEGAGLVYALNAVDPTDTAPNGLALAGAIAFSGTPQKFGTAGYRGVLAAIGQTPAGELSDEYRFYTDGSLNAETRVSSQRFDGSYPATTTESCGQTSCARIYPLPVSFTLASGSSPAEHGTDSATGISWGRWAASDTTLANRITDGSSSGSLQNNSYLHVIMTPNQTGPVALPITGTATYTLAGGTSPTNQAGNVGTLGAATLSANFTAKTVDISIPLTISSQNWNASASEIPIQNGAFFHANSLPTGPGTDPALVVSCNGECSGPAYGTLKGMFTGRSGQGAAVAYSLGNASTVVSGVAAFKR